MNYTSYDFYISEYLQGKEGIISVDLFPYYSQKASYELRNVIRLDMFDTTKITEEMQLATCEVAEILCEADGNTNESDIETGTSVPIGISSEKVGEYSVSYTGNSLSEGQALTKSKISDAITKWLGPTGLLFRGVI